MLFDLYILWMFFFTVALREVSIWSILSEHLESVLLLGRMYRHIGDQRRARCYFKEGLKVCESQGWIKWYVHFTMKSNFHSQSEK